MNALRYNDPTTNDGIRTTRRFASPQNRRAVSTFPQFVDLFEGPNYAPMLGHDAALYAPLGIDGDRATVRVVTYETGSATGHYEFRMRKVDSTDASLTGYVQFRESRRLPSVSREGGNLRPYVAYAESWASRVTTGFGVRPFRLAVCMLTLFAVATILYEVDPGIADSVYYSVVTFTTAPPPGDEPTMPVVRAVELIETFGGTLLIVLLGYVLGNRERF